MLESWRDRMRTAARSPLAWILLVACALRVVGLAWGLPASDGWDNDGIAPRDFLSGLVLTFTPGRYFTYPPVHLALLGVLTAPVSLVALARAPSFAPADVVHEMIRVPYMTIDALVARVVTVAMSLVVVRAVAKMAEEVAGRRAGWCAAAFASVSVPFTYYAHTTNLDVPYLCWGSLGLLALVRAVARHEPRRLRAMAVLAVLAIGSKDQAYALFGLTVPVAIALWIALDAWGRAHARAILKEVAIAAAIGAGLLLVCDAIVFNPSGFAARLRFLSGPASQDFAYYSNDWAGRAQVIRWSVQNFGEFYPLPFALLVVVGLAMRLRARDDGARRAAGLVPVLAIVSFTLLFNCVARRAEHRFLLPQTTLWAVYGGIALERLVFGLRRPAARAIAQLAASVGFAVALFGCMTVDANLLLDPRYDAEHWMRENVRPGDTIEVHALNVYLPRFPAQARVERVGQDPVTARNPLPDVTEVQDHYENVDARRPRFIVVCQGWVWRYLLDAPASPNATAHEGYLMPPTYVESATNRDATSFFKRLVRGEHGYRRVYRAAWTSAVWPKLDIHGALAEEIWIYEREP